MLLEREGLGRLDTVAFFLLGDSGGLLVDVASDFQLKGWPSTDLSELVELLCFLSTSESDVRWLVDCRPRDFTLEGFLGDIGRDVMVLAINLGGSEAWFSWRLEDPSIEGFKSRE